MRGLNPLYKADSLPVLICFGYHSKSTKVVDKSPTTGINIVILPPCKHLNAIAGHHLLFQQVLCPANDLMNELFSCKSY